MSVVLQRADVSATLDAAHVLVDDLHASDLSCGTDDSLLDALREVERLQRRLAFTGYALIAEADTRGPPGTYGARSMSSWLAGLLHLDAGDAHARVAAAAAAGPRRSAGQHLAPIFEQVAAAQADGTISQRHAHVVVHAVDALPDQAQAEHGVQVEADLVAHARTFNPTDLARIAARVLDCYDRRRCRRHAAAPGPRTRPDRPPAPRRICHRGRGMHRRARRTPAGPVRLPRRPGDAPRRH